MAEAAEDRCEEFGAKLYLLGTKAAGSKPRLIVEVSRVRSRQHSFIIDRLRDALAEQNLSKEAALELRDTLCAQYP